MGVLPNLAGLLATCLALAGCAVPSESAKETGPTPTGSLLFALLDPGDGEETARRYLARDDVDGVAVRLGWATLEPSDDAHAWDRLDGLMRATDAAGKQATLHILASGYAPAPPWLYAAGAQPYSYSFQGGPTRTDPVPWDDVYLAEWTEFLAALAAHLDAAGLEGSVWAISVAVPVPEMSLVACADGRLAPGIAYSRQAYLDAWRASIEAYHEAFPDVTLLVPAPVGVICRPDNDGPKFYRDALADGPRDRRDAGLAMYATDLNAKGTDRLDGVAQEQPLVQPVLQFIAAATGDRANRMQGPLLDAICAGHTYDAAAFEVYKADLDNTDAGEAVAAIADPNLCGA